MNVVKDNAWYLVPQTDFIFYNVHIVCECKGANNLDRIKVYVLVYESFL